MQKVFSKSKSGILFIFQNERIRLSLKIFCCLKLQHLIEKIKKKI